jgi:hypothetical protein
LNNSLNNENDKNDLKFITNEYELLKSSLITIIKYINQLHNKKNINKNEITRSQINNLILNLINSHKKNSKNEDENIKGIINEMEGAKNTIKSRLKMRSLTNKSIRKFKEDEKKIKADSLGYNLSSKKLPTPKYFSSLNIISTQNADNINNKSINQNIKEENNTSSILSSKNSNKSSSIDYNSDSTNNFKEINENNNNNKNENNLLELIKNNEKNLSTVKDDLNNKIHILGEKMDEINNNIQKYFTKSQNKKK